MPLLVNNTFAPLIFVVKFLNIHGIYVYYAYFFNLFLNTLFHYKLIFLCLQLLFVGILITIKKIKKKEKCIFVRFRLSCRLITRRQLNLKFFSRGFWWYIRANIKIDITVN